VIKSVSKAVNISLIAISLVGVGTIGNFQSVSASTWHKGTPKVMQGTWKVKGGGHMTIGKTSINYGPKLGSSAAKYKYLGHHKYAVNTKLGGTLKVVATKHHLKMQGTSYYR
jgi:hypothetical protein